MRQGHFHERLRTWSRHLWRTLVLHASHKSGMQQSLSLQELLASEMTHAVLRADALELRCFEATLQAAAERLRAPHGES
jgi:hypothetical protein